MLLYRSAVLGLLGALLLLVAERGGHRPRPAAVDAPVVVDVSRTALAAAQIPPAALVGTRPGERIVAVDGEAHRALEDAWALTPEGGFVDVELAGRGARRRVLLLVHR